MSSSAPVGYRSSVLQPYTPSVINNYPAEYFAGINVSIFFNDQYIDEIRDFEFTLEEKITPIYGYASYTAKTIVHGNRLIQGSFSINMRAGDYLHEMMYQDYSNSIIANSNTSASLSSLNLTQPDPASNPDAFAAWQMQQKNLYWQTASASVAKQDLSRVNYFENSGFTIFLVYGDVDAIDLSRNVGRVRTIENVHPSRAAQEITYSGENICERWQFAAVDMNTSNRANEGYNSLLS